MSARQAPTPSRPPTPAAAAVERFGAAILDHATLSEARRELARCLAPGKRVSIVLLEGPTGGGKTTLVNAIMRDVRAGLIGPSHPDPCRVVYEICPRPGANGVAFDMGFWASLAHSGGSPTPGAHRHPDAEAARLLRGYVPGMRPTIESTRRGALAFLRACGTRLVVIDEAQHITEARGGQALARHLDVVKISVDSEDMTFLLVGTYALRAHVLGNGQLARRTKVVHLRPYHPGVDGDVDAFKAILSQLVQALPLRDIERTQENFEPRVHEILFWCAGCVGVLKEWLTDALSLALESARPSISWSYMKKTRPAESQLRDMAADIRQYRDACALTSLPAIEADLGFGLKSRDLLRASKASRSSASSSRRPARPGSRGPARDPVYVSQPDPNLPPSSSQS